MSDQPQGDYPSPTASQSGPYPHRPTANAAANASAAAVEAQLAQQLLQANEHAQHVSQQQQAGGDYGRGGQGQGQQAGQSQAVSDAQQAMQWSAAGGGNATGGPQHGMPAPSGTPHGGPQYAQYAPDMQQIGQPQGSPDDDEPSKKKQKTSRACDECRRKKIKCDGDGEKPGYKCANCLRTNAECLYTKPAQKRGPSRGYIRELSDRVASLEELRVGGSPMTPQNPSSIFAEGADSHGVKRTHSISEHANSDALKAPFSVATPSNAPFARMGSANRDGSHVQLHFKMPTVSQPLTPAERNDLNTFMSAAQPRLPILPDDIKDTEHLLDAAAGPVRDTFILCIRAALALPASSDRSLYKQAYTSAVELAHRPETISALANVVHMQICVLLIYISGTYGPVNPEAIDEPNEKPLYSTVMGIAGVLGLGGSVSSAKDAVEDLTVRHGRRVYGLFHFLGVWNSLAHGHGLLAPVREFKPDSFDGKTAATDGYLYTAMVPDLAYFQNRFAKEDTETDVAQLFWDGVKMGLAVIGNTDVDRLDSGLSAAKSCIEIFREVSEYSTKARYVNPKLLQAASDVVRAFGSDPAPFYMVGHQALGLATRVLVQAAKHTDTREDAAAALSDAQGLLDGGKLLHEDGWRGPIEKAVKAALDSKAEDKPASFSWMEIVHGGWMQFAA